MVNGENSVELRDAFAGKIAVKWLASKNPKSGEYFSTFGWLIMLLFSRLSLASKRFCNSAAEVVTSMHCNCLP